MTTTNDDLIDGTEAAAMLGVKRANVSHYETRGTLPLGREEWHGKRRRPLYHRADVEKLKAVLDAKAALKPSLESA